MLIILRSDNPTFSNVILNPHVPRNAAYAVGSQNREGKEAFTPSYEEGDWGVYSSAVKLLAQNTKPITSKTTKILIFGDTALLEPLGSRAVNDPTYNPFSNVMPFFENYDYIVGKLETTIDGESVGVPNPGKNYTFSIPKISAKIFKDAGIDAFNYATNHTKDYGEASVIHTIELLEEQGIEHFGAGANNEEAFAPLIVEIKGTKIAFLAFNSAEYAFNIAGPNSAGTASFIEYLARPSIENAKANSDIVIVMAEWGEEHTTELNDLQKQWANIFTSAGADLVVGGHPHVRQASDVVNGVEVIYSIGNFMFPGQAWDPEAQKGWMVEVVVEDKKIKETILHDMEMDFEGVPKLVSSK